MSRHIPEHPKKGSAEAYEWAERMRQARQKKARTKARVREAGQLTEMQFFGPGGSLEVKKNPRRRRQYTHITTLPSDPPTYSVTLNRRVHKTGLTGRQAFSLQRQLHAKGYSSKMIEEAAAENPRTRNNLYRVCAWCKKDMGQTAPYSDKRLTHSICQACLKKEMATLTKKNPIAVYNPPAPKVVGTIYNKAIEIRAKKTGSDLAGKYKHVFGKNVKILGLDNGDVVIHHTGGKRLWISREDYERSGGKHE